MTSNFQFYAPNGGEIRGTYEVVPGFAPVTFGDGERSFQHAGGTEMHWDATVTQSINKVPMFADYDGHDWLQHHLIPSEQSLSKPTLEIIQHELKVGQALEAARALRSALSELPKNHVMHDLITLPTAIHELGKAYDVAKSLTITAIERELAMRQTHPEDDAAAA
mgnify:CR=1 FL=1